MNAPQAKHLDITEAMLAWPKAKEFIRPAIREEAQEVMLNEIGAKIATGLSSLWELRDASGEIVAYAIAILYTTNGVSIVAQLHVAVAQGLEILLDHLPQFESWATQKGADTIEVIGREGWTKVLKPLGFTLDHISLTKRIARGLH